MPMYLAGGERKSKTIVRNTARCMPHRSGSGLDRTSLGSMFSMTTRLRMTGPPTLPACTIALSTLGITTTQPRTLRKRKRQGPWLRAATLHTFPSLQGPASFFLLDTRTYRSSNLLPLDDTAKTMLGPAQLEDFIAFLQKPEPRGQVEDCCKLRPFH